MHGTLLVFLYAFHYTHHYAIVTSAQIGSWCTFRAIIWWGYRYTSFWYRYRQCVGERIGLPMFLLGVFLQPLREWLTRLHNYKFEVVLSVLAVAIILFCGEYNGYVWMYRCGYGNSFLLFVVGALGGIMLLYVVSLWACRLLYSSIVEKLSSGSILIVGIHIIIVRRLMELPNRTWGEDLLFSLMILLAFYPIIILTERYCPILLGQYRRKGKV